MAVSGSFIDVPNGTGQQARVPGSIFEGYAEIALDTYSTNGLTVATLTAPLNMRQVIDFVPICVGPTLTATLNTFSYDRANGKVKFYNGTTEVSNAADISAFKLYVRVSGLR